MFFFMVGVAQLVEHWIVVPVAAGSNPVAHPIVSKPFKKSQVDISILRQYCELHQF